MTPSLRERVSLALDVLRYGEEVIDSHYRRLAKDRKAEGKRLADEVKALNSGVNRLTSQLEETADAYVGLQEKHRDLEEKYSTLSADYSNIQEQLGHLSRRLEASLRRNEKIHGLEETVRLLQEKVREQQTYIGDLETFYRDLYRAETDPSVESPITLISKVFSTKSGLLVGVPNGKIADNLVSELTQRYGLQLEYVATDKIRKFQGAISGVDYVICILGQKLSHNLTNIVKGDYGGVQLITVLGSGLPAVELALHKAAKEQIGAVTG